MVVTDTAGAPVFAKVSDKRGWRCRSFHKTGTVFIISSGQDGDHCKKCALIYPIGQPWDAWRHQFSGPGRNR